MLVTTVAITAIVAFAVIGWRVVRGDGDPLLGSTVEWDELALVDRTTGRTLTIDDAGETVQRFVGRGSANEVYTLGERVAIVGPTQIVLDGREEPLIIPIERSDTVTPLRTSDTLHLVIGRPTGGNVVIIDVDTGEQLDVGALAEQRDPLLFAETVRSTDDGSAFAVADARRFQTIVVRSDETTATFFPSQPLALSDDRVVTSQIVGRQADIGVFDRDSNSKARVPTELPAGGVMIDDALLMVSTGGGVYRVTDDATEADRIGEIALPSGATVTSVARSFDGERLVVTGSVFQAIVDLDGTTLFSTTFTSPVSTEPPSPVWRCLPVGGDDTYHSLVSLDDGEQIVDLTGVSVTGVSQDGCTVLGERNGLTEVISEAGAAQLGRVRAATLGPDGSTVVRTTTAGITELITIGDDLELEDTVDISDVTPVNALVAFIDS